MELFDFAIKLPISPLLVALKLKVKIADIPAMD